MGANLPISFSLVEAVLTSPHAAALMSGNDTHEPTMRLVARLVRHTHDPDFIKEIIASLLPTNYSGNTLDEIAGMVSSAIKKGFHVAQDRGGRGISQPKASEECLRLARSAGMELFKDEVGDAYASIPQPGGGVLTHAVRSGTMKRWVRGVYHSAKGKPISQQAFAEVLDTIEALAETEGAEKQTHVRIGSAGDSIFIDIGDATGRLVEITTSGWEIKNACPIKFVRPPGLGVLPLPTRGGELSPLQMLLGLDDNQWVLVLAFLINCYQPTGPYMCLILSAEQGAGKSFLSEVLKRIVDPSAVRKTTLPKNEHELMIHATQHALLVFDNVSRVNWDISDVLSILATGGGLLTRKYYTDNESRIFNQMRPFILNGIGAFADRPDLLDRAINVHLAEIPADKRKTERTMLADFEAMLPVVLGHLYDIVSGALDRRHAVAPPTTIRMADAAQWLTASETAAGLPAGTFMQALRESQASVLAEQASNDPLLTLLSVWLSAAPNRVFEGSVSELHAELQARTEPRERWLPQTPAHLSNRLTRTKPLAANIGINIEFLPRNRKGSRVRISILGDSDANEGSEKTRDTSGRPKY
jgi:hypothetical protein